MTLRPLLPADIDALLAIEEAATPYPWSRKQFADGFEAGEFGWGVEADAHLVAFAIFNSVLDEASLLDIAVHPYYQRRGLARELLAACLHELQQRGSARCLLEVRISNGAAIALYRALEFSDDGRRRHYYPTANGREDALLMSRSLTDA